MRTNYKAQFSEKSDIYNNIYFVKTAGSMSHKGSWMYFKQVKNKRYKRMGFKTEREAAIALDKALIEDGNKPINIFIKK